MFFSLQDLDTTLRILDEGRQTPFIYIKTAFCVNLMVAFPSSEDTVLSACGQILATEREISLHVFCILISTYSSPISTQVCT